MKCPNCGFENKPDTLYCEKCMEPLEAAEGKWVYKDKDAIISRPCSSQMLQDLYDKGVIGRKTPVRPEGTTEWKPFCETELFEPFKTSAHKKLTALIVVLVLIAFAAGGYYYIRHQAETAREAAIQQAKEEEERFSASYEEAAASLKENGWSIVEGKTFAFENTPIPVYDKGYIVQVEGKWGVIGLDGNYLVEPEYAALTIDGQVQEHTVFYEEAGNTATAKSLEYLLGINENNVVSIPAAYEGVTISSSRNVTLPDGLSKEEILTPITINQEESWTDMFSAEAQYYIWNPANDRVFGPFPISKPAMFNLEGEMIEEYYPVPGMFFVERDGRYTIYTNNGSTKTSQTFNYARPISDAYMLVSNLDQLGSMDYSLKVTFIGKVQNASAPIKGVDYVEIENQWYRIYNPAVADQAEISSEEENTEGEDEESQENKDKDKGEEYELVYNMYVRSSPGGSIARVASAGSVVEVVSTTEDNGMVYGELSDGGWICIFDGTRYYANSLGTEEDTSEDTEEEENTSDDKED